MTSKQRASLRSIATSYEQVYQIGKSDLALTQLDALDTLLEKRELIKIGVLRACPVSASELSVKIADELKAEVVAVVGSKIILYRRSLNDKIKHIEF